MTVCLLRSPACQDLGSPSPGLRGRGEGVVGGWVSPLLFDFPLLSFLPSRHLISNEKSLLSLPFSVLGKSGRKIPTRWWPLMCEGPHGLQTPSTSARLSSDQPPAWGRGSSSGGQSIPEGEAVEGRHAVQRDHTRRDNKGCLGDCRRGAQTGTSLTPSQEIRDCLETSIS